MNCIALMVRHDLNFDHLPNFYGTVKTNLGDGFIVDLVRDYQSKRGYRGALLPTDYCYSPSGEGIKSPKRFIVKTLLENKKITNRCVT